MSRYQAAGNIRVNFVTPISNQAAPTQAEVRAGVNLSTDMPRDGIKIPQTANTIDISTIDTPVNKTGVGTIGGDAITLTGYRDNSSETMYNTLVPASSTLPNGTQGYLVVR